MPDVLRSLRESAATVTDGAGTVPADALAYTVFTSGPAGPAGVDITRRALANVLGPAIDWRQDGGLELAGGTGRRRCR